MSLKYYRFLESPNENWKPYWQDPDSGRRMEFHSHLDEMFASALKEGDYLLLGEDGDLVARCPTSYDKYRGVGFDDMPPLEKLLNSGVVVEVPEEILNLDWQLQARIEVLVGAIEELEEKLEELYPKMSERRFFFLTQEARECQHIYGELKPMFDGLCRELEEVHGEMEDKVIKPLGKLAEERKELLMSSVDDLIFGASSRGIEVLGMKREFEVERDISF